MISVLQLILNYIMASSDESQHPATQHMSSASSGEDEEIHTSSDRGVKRRRSPRKHSSSEKAKKPRRPKIEFSPDLENSIAQWIEVNPILWDKSNKDSS